MHPGPNSCKKQAATVRQLCGYWAATGRLLCGNCAHMYRYCTTTAPLGACCMIMLFVGKNGCPCTMAHGKHELFLKFFSGKLPASGVLVKVARQGCSERAAYSASTLSYSLRACSSRLLDKAAMPGLRALHQLQTACFCLAHQARPTRLLGKACARCINSKPPVSGLLVEVGPPRPLQALHGSA